MVRAELLERGIRALGMETAGEAGTRIASGVLPAAVVLEPSAAVEPGIESLARRVPLVVVSAATDPEAWPAAAARVLRRPVRVGEVAAAVIELLGKDGSA